MMMRLLIKLVLVAGIAYSSLAVAEAAPSVPATVSYDLPTPGPLPRTYRVTLAITAPDNPDWIVSTFVAGEPRTVTVENQGRFTETWDGLDDNFMPVPPGEYGLKGIYMPSEVWAPDGKPHTLRARYLSGPNALMPRPGRGESGPFITGDQCEPGMGDVAVGPDGVAVFYWKFLENAQNAYRVDLNLPLGPEQLLGGFNSGGMGGGPRVATDGETVWAVCPDAEGLFLYVKPFICRADERPFGTDHSRYRRNVTVPDGHVTGLAAWRPPAGQSSVLYVAERGRIVETPVKSQHFASLFRESAEERVNIVRALDGATAKELSRVAISEPAAIALANGVLHVLIKLPAEQGWGVTARRLNDDGTIPAEGWSDPTVLPGLIRPTGLAVDSLGHHFVADPELNQVLRFAADGKLEHKLGRLDRQPGGDYDPNTFMEPTRVVCWRDKAGIERLLVAETGGPSRVSEWTTDGPSPGSGQAKLLRDWGYSLSGNNQGALAVDPDSPEHVYLKGANHTFLRYRVDYGSGEWTLEKVWHDIYTSGYPEIINYAGHKYLAFKLISDVPNLWRFDGDRLLPSAGIIREGGHGAANTPYFVWHDANGNGKVDDAERRPLEMPRGFDRYWGDYRQGDLSLLVPRAGTPDLYRLPVKELDAHGNPVHGDWEKVLTDEIYAAKAAGTATALCGGNEAVSAFNGDWGSARQLPTLKKESPGDIIVNMSGGGFSANYHWQHKLSRYVPDGQGGFRQKWRVGRIANIVPGRGEIHGSIHVTQPMHGLIAIIDQTRAGVHVYDWESGLYIDTLMLPIENNHLGSSVYNSPGEFFSGGAHEAHGKVYLRWGKAIPALVEVEGWTKDLRLQPINSLPASVTISAGQIATPPDLALQIRGGAGAAKVACFQPMPGGAPALDGSPAGWESCEPMLFGDNRAKAEVRAGYDPETLFLRWEVTTEQPMTAPPLPSPERMFTHERGATTLSFYLQGDANATGKEVAGRPGDVRIVFSLYDDNGTIRPTALGVYPRWDGVGEGSPFTYASPWRSVKFAHAGLLETVKLDYRLSDDRRRLVLTAAIPHSALPHAVPDLAAGWRTAANFDMIIGGAHKQWWANADGSASREMNDEPSEAFFYPGSWGQALFAPLDQGLPVQTWLLNGPWKMAPPPDLSSANAPNVKRQIQQFFDQAVFPPDDRTIVPESIAAAGASPKPGQWRLAQVSIMDHCLGPDDRRALYGNLYYAAAWIHAPEAMKVELTFPMDPHNNISAWLNETPLPDTVSGGGVYHRVTSPQKVTLKPGWNQLFLRAYAVGYRLRFGVVLNGQPEQLWRLRLSTTPPINNK
jgi:hypothetical protein